MHPALRLAFLTAIAVMIGGIWALGARNHALQAQAAAVEISR